MTGRTRALGDGLLIWAAGAVAPGFVRLLGATWRVSISGAEAVEDVHASGRSVIYAFWHGQLLALEYVYRGRGICVLSSLHRDGEMSARLMRALGYAVVRGSTTRGSVRGLARMLANLKDGRDLAITPDGPRGPARTAQPGIFFLSERSGAPIIPVAAWAHPAKRLTSWDGFAIPVPFARVAIAYGRPIEPEPSEDPVARAAELSLRLNRLTDAARTEAHR